MKARRSDFALAEAIKEPGFSPRRADLPELFELLAGDERSARDAERALSGFDRSIHAEVVARFRASAPPLRGRLCRLIGRLARRHPADLLPVLIASLSDPDDKTRRIVVSVMYASNVEEYLLDQRTFRRWVDNVSAQPTDGESLFVRAFLDANTTCTRPSSKGTG